MSLAVGTRIGPYEITGTLGAGGMGEVYRAHDARLARDVALKVLPDLFAGDPERLARFQREAQVLAALKHPNIGAIYGLEEGPAEAGPSVQSVDPSVGRVGAGFSRPMRALVLELVEGDTLADRIARGASADRRGGPLGPPMPIDEVLPIAKQIAEALESAHEQGVIHRDLKPSNIKVSPDGVVKVLDFGLAKITENVGRVLPSRPAGSKEQDPAYILSQSPTITSPAAMTGAGTILGTAAYMAPEQAKGRPADKRSDVWAFGCVLYEMLTGKRAFEGEDVSDTLAAVLRAEPDWTALPRDVTAPIRSLLRRCLEKDRRKRIGDIAAALFAIDEALSLNAEGPAKAGPHERERELLVWRRALPYAAAVAVTAAGAGYAAWALKPAPAAAVTRFSITLPEGEAFISVFRHLVALSPDGTRLVYAANNRLYLRALDQLDAAPLRGTEGIGIASPQSPFFSFDGEWIGFWAEGQLKKVSVSGGAPVTLCVAQPPFGVSWGPDDTIVFGQGPAGIWRVSGNGGNPENIVKLDGGQRAAGPQMLPDGRTLLFTLATGGAARWDQAQVVTHSLDTGARTILINGGTDARYVPTGHIVYALRGTLLAVPFDSESHQVTGGPVPLVEDVWAAAVTGVAHFSVSADGALVYVPGISAEAVRRTLVWVDRQEREEPITAPPRPYNYPRLSPDGTQIALDIVEENRDIWVWDLARGTLTRLTFDPALDRAPVWTSDGRRIIFSSDRGGTSNLYWQPANGTADAERLTQSPKIQNAASVTPDGTRVVFHESTNSDISLMALALAGSHQVQPLVQNLFVNENAAISPDGRWLAYESNASGQDEVYVRPFPDVGGGQWQISTAGGEQALWARNGRELFYRAPDGAVMGVSVDADQAFTTSTPTRLIDGRYYGGETGPRRAWRTFDVSPDGRRFLMIKNPEQTQQAAAVQRIIVVRNWFEELKRRVPVP